MKWFSGITVGMLPGFLANEQGSTLIDCVVQATHGRFEVSDMVGLLYNQSIQLWAAGEEEVIKGMVLSEIVDYPRKRVLRLFGLYGSGLNDLITYLPIIKTWAIAQGCQEIGLEETRAGLELAVPGFERTGVCLRMDLDSLSNMEMAGAA